MPFILLSQIPYTGIDDMRPTAFFLFLEALASALMAYGSIYILPRRLSMRFAMRKKTSDIIQKENMIQKPIEYSYPLLPLYRASHEYGRESLAEKKTENHPWEIKI